MSNSYGENLHLTIFGQSHSPAIGMTLDGIPAGKQIDFRQLQTFMTRRAPGHNDYSTPRKEADIPQFIAGMKDGVTCGSPITAIIPNTNTRSKDYDLFTNIPRPGHADYTAQIKYGTNYDHAGGGQFSGRMTAPLCIAGGICIQLLKEEGIEIISRIYSIKDIYDNGELVSSTSEKPFPVVDDRQGELMLNCIRDARIVGDSVGGIIECAVLGLPAGLGDHMFYGMENRISSIIFGIPAIKGIEFGSGFASAALYGSENNDSFYIDNGTVKTKTNHCGGILGGITNGMPLTFKAAVKPTPSIQKLQNSVNIKEMKNQTLSVGGRHDPCIVPRAVPCVEAAAAIAIYDALLARKKETR